MKHPLQHHLWIRIHQVSVGDPSFDRMFTLLAFEDDELDEMTELGGMATDEDNLGMDLNRLTPTQQERYEALEILGQQRALMWPLGDDGRPHA